MDISESLEALRGKFPDCMTVAFADISTGMVLASSSQEHLNQEHLDALCATAADMLSGETAQRVSTVFEGDAPIQHAIIFERAEVGLFLKSLHAPNEVLCCACGSGIDLVAFLRHARHHFADFESCLGAA